MVDSPNVMTRTAEAGVQDLPSLALPTFDDLEDASFATVDAYLRVQRAIVAIARRVVDADADSIWRDLDESARDRFDTARDGIDDALTAWRRAWWLHVIGGHPRAPFEIATSAERAERLLHALGAVFSAGTLPTDRPAEFERWWRELQAETRRRISAYVAARVASAERRLAADGLRGQPPVATIETPDDVESKRRRSRRVSRADRERIRLAAERAVAAHRELDHLFHRLGPVCAACTQESGGCCSLTVPLLWREADFQLLAMGDAIVPEPLAETAGACPFLGPAGCRLPSERRPHICRTFLCDRAEAALGDGLPAVRAEIDDLTSARSQLVR